MPKYLLWGIGVDVSVRKPSQMACYAFVLTWSLFSMNLHADWPTLAESGGGSVFSKTSIGAVAPNTMQLGLDANLVVLCRRPQFQSVTCIA